MQAAARPPMPGGMGMMPQSNGPAPGLGPMGGGMPQMAPGQYMAQPPGGYNNHPSHPGAMPYRFKIDFL